MGDGHCLARSTMRLDAQARCEGDGCAHGPDIPQLADRRNADNNAVDESDFADFQNLFLGAE
jgi:hypothetical protein